MIKNGHILFWSVTVALGGFLFGFDTAVISGAEQTIQTVWQLSSVQHGLTVSIALIGTVIGALFGGIPSDALGRKKTLFWIAVLYLVSALGSALATDWFLFLFFRFIGGLGVGASSVAAPMYISEISPPKSRGRLVALFQFNVVFGILIAYFSNYLIGTIWDLSWRWMLGVEAFPALIFLILVLFVPESPRWLITKTGNLADALKTLKISNPEGAVAEMKAIQNAAEIDSAATRVPFFSKKYSFPITLAILFAMFNQLSGINAIIYYAPRIFVMTGLGTEASLLSTAGIGITNFAATLLAMNFIDRVGRRKLMLIGSFGLIITLGLVSYSFFTESFGGMWVPIYLFLYIAFFAFSQGAVIWVFISEIFPNRVRAYGQCLGSFTHWLMAAIIAFIFPIIAEALGGGVTFLLFSGMMVLQLLFVIKMMPETNGMSLEEMETSLHYEKV
ncbi:SP family arabinose:H+ symporter-like MFS transporter [Catalinimonas alkaloidigena]|uniref:sugar porter family MFS transporter n=1 Tax=Catalinimonas alkaloidigena TaxID=1075417 RepID=UPI0024053448|nr:sugar porter family MFS transporter [Catalinimonas alkaloidigena]MDF9800172.1 SP family arabinose:H+ symporter-like MFS transporter [Catalinimonas alkaloidigena]